ncbi:MAG: sigma-70 family RNA polymerase sigma factor [Tepidisphaeraceae bacterium]
MDEAIRPSDVQTDSQIVDRVQRGDVQAYRALVERYERAAAAAVLSILRDAHGAQDVVQDVFVLCFKRLSSLRDGSRFGPWLLRVASREAVHASRRDRRMRIASADATEAGTSEEPPPLFDDERERLLDCVRRLPAHERVVVSLRYFEGRPVHEIASITGRPVGTVTKQLTRAIERLRGELESRQPSWQMNPSVTR